MTKDVALADLQEHLAEHMDEVQQGVTINVVDGEKTIAEIRQPEEIWVWENGMHVRPAKGNMRDVKLPPPLKLDRDPVEYLLEDRDARDEVDEYLDRLRKRPKQ